MLLGVGYSECNESNWQEYYNSEGHNMEGCVLSGIVLEWVNLSGANLERANLSNTNFTDANFTDTNCRGAFFVGADLENTDFYGANLLYAYFDENEDTYEDISYDAGAMSGDLNLDGIDNILDIVILANNILNP